MVGILLKIGKQSENVGEEEVFGRFCIRDVTENPSGGLLRRADIRRISGGYPADIRRISALQKAGFAPRVISYPADIRPPENGFWGQEGR